MMIRSLARPAMNSSPPARKPRSPVRRKHGPPGSVARVAQKVLADSSGRFQYPAATEGPLTHTSPTSSGAAGRRLSGSTTTTRWRRGGAAAPPPPQLSPHPTGARPPVPDETGSAGEAGASAGPGDAATAGEAGAASGGSVLTRGRSRSAGPQRAPHRARP